MDTQIELGNMLFGNSRGEFLLERSEGWEDQLHKLFEFIDPDYWYQVEYENSTFCIMAYWWGSCTCGWDDFATELEEMEHQPDCYTFEYELCVKEDGYSTDYKKLKKVYEKHGWNTKGKDWWHGCALKCSCGYNERYEERFIELCAEFTEIIDNCIKSVEQDRSKQ
jgi:hypothetical protein